MFEYVDFRHFDFSGINLFKDYEYSATTIVVYQTMKEPSWISLYKGLLAYLVFLESPGLVYGDLLRDQRIHLQALLT